MAPGLFAAVPEAAGELGEGFYFSSGLVDTPRTNLVGPRSWVVYASGFYDAWGEAPSIGAGENINKDISLGTLRRLDKVDSIFYLVAGKHDVSLFLLGKGNFYGGIGGLIDSGFLLGLAKFGISSKGYSWE